MPAIHQSSMLSVRLPAAQLRRLKSHAAAQGITMQTAVQQALEVWLAQPEPAAPSGLDAFLARLQGSLAGTDALGLLRREKVAERIHDRRRERLGSAAVGS